MSFPLESTAARKSALATGGTAPEIPFPPYWQPVFIRPPEYDQESNGGRFYDVG
ncbi:MAG: hypothetical protein NNA31_06960 [Nitrospira sp.]|nr:hypothetical protein [Nitrospira sp.]